MEGGDLPAVFRFIVGPSFTWCLKSWTNSEENISGAQFWKSISFHQVYNLWKSGINCHFEHELGIAQPKFRSYFIFYNCNTNLKSALNSSGTVPTNLSLKCSLVRQRLAQLPLFVLPADPESGKANATPSSCSLDMFSLSSGLTFLRGSMICKTISISTWRICFKIYLLNLLQCFITVTLDIGSLCILEVTTAQVGSYLEQESDGVDPKVKYGYIYKETL